MPDWVVIYLIGCAAALCLQLVSIALFYALTWMLKGNILRKNLKKLEPPDDETFWQKAATFAFILTLEVALSWFDVLLMLVLIPWRLFNILREVVTSAPEEIKRLRFPVLNNPDMSPESVWAHVRAFEAKGGGEQPNAQKLLWSLQATTDNRPQFDRAEALHQLKNLNAVNPEVVASALEQLPRI